MANSGIYEEDYGQDSDHESLYADADSPTDGYFTQRSFPRAQFVENSSVAAEAITKAREAAESRGSTTQISHASQLTPSTPPSRSQVWTNADEQTPLLDAGPAPPDYAAATAHRSSANSDNSTRREDASQRPQSYGSIPESQPGSAVETYQWPLGNRGSPFNNPNFPFGPAGAPWNDPHFPFGRNNSPFANTSFRGRTDPDTGMPAFRVGPPQSMSGGHQPQYAGREDEEAATPAITQTRKQKRNRKLCSNCFRPCSFLSWLLFLGIVASLVCMVSFGGSKKPSHEVPPPDDSNPSRKDPSKTPVDHNQPQVPIPPQDPIIPNFPANRSLSHCPFITFTDTHQFNFSSPEFHFIELMESRVAAGVDISGTVWVQPAPTEQEVDIRVFVSYATTKHWRVAVKRFVQQEDSLKLDFPELEQQANPGFFDSSCLDVAVAIQVRKGVRLAELSITSANLNVIAEEGLFDMSETPGSPWFDIANTSSITAVRGKIDMAYWSSRETVIDIVSGSIHGNFALRDLLVLKSQSGSISASVDPREVDPSKPAPASLIATSASGSVNFKLPLTGRIADRDYRTRIESRSGHITGDYYLGTTTTIISSSSSISANILPYDWSGWSSSLHTESKSGSSDIRVLPSYKRSDCPVGHVHSYHKAGSSSLKLRYPSQWSGTMDGESISGSVKIRGKGVVVDFDDRYSRMAHHVVAHKGDGSSTMDFRSISGSVDLAIGDDW